MTFMCRIILCKGIYFFRSQFRSLIHLKFLRNTGCFKKTFTLVLQMLLCGECYAEGLQLMAYNDKKFARL
jgi:hypothetical protein